MRSWRVRNFLWGFAPDLAHYLAVNIHFLPLRLKNAQNFWKIRVIDICWCFAPDIVVISRLQLNILIKKPCSPIMFQIEIKFKHSTKRCFKVLRISICKVKNFCWGFAPDPISKIVPLIMYCLNILWKLP